MCDRDDRKRHLRTLLSAAVGLLDDVDDPIPNMAVAYQRCSHAVSELWKYAYLGPPALPRSEARRLLVELSLTAMVACLDLGLLSVDPTNPKNGG